MDKEMYKVMIADLMRKESELKQQVLELTMENAELKDMVLDNGGDYTKDFEVKRDIIYESPDGGKTIYSRRAGDSVREQFNRECD